MTQIGEFSRQGAGRVGLDLCTPVYTSVHKGRSDSPTRVSGAAMWSIIEPRFVAGVSSGSGAINWIVCRLSLRLI